MRSPRSRRQGRQTTFHENIIGFSSVNGPLPPKLAAYRDQQIAQDYDHRWASAAGRRRDRRKGNLLRQALADFDQVMTILDVPCGTARFAGVLGDKYRWLGADLSLEMLRYGSHKHPRAKMVAADLANLPFADNSFDVVICIRLFHLVPDPELRASFLREIYRVARCGVICGWHHDRSFKIWGRRLRHRWGWRLRPPSNPHPNTVRKQMLDAGFDHLKWLPLRKLPFTSEKVLVSASKPNRDDQQ